eukprot:1459185-Pyramimonas_sp.AAC.1
MGRTKDTQSWRRLEDRIAMHSSVDAEEYDRVAIVAQPPRTRADGTSYLCTPLLVGQHGMTTMNAKSRGKYCSGLRNISMQDELQYVCDAVLSAPGMSVTGQEIVENVIRDTDPLRGHVGTNLAGVLLYVIGIAFACP